MSLIKKLAGETAIYGTSSILTRLLNWVILTSFYTYYFTEQADFGIVNELFTYIAFLLILLTYRMETTFFRFGSEKGQLNISFSTASITVFGITAVIVTILFLNQTGIARLVKMSDHTNYLKWPFLILIFDALAAVPFARLRFDNRPIRFALLKIAAVLINLFLIFFFLVWCPQLIENGWSALSVWYNRFDPVEYIFLANLCASAVIFLALLPLYRYILTFKKEVAEKILDQTIPASVTPSKQIFDIALFRKMIKYATPLVIVGLAGIVNQLSGYPFLSWFGGETTEEGRRLAGIYSGGLRLAMIMTLFNQAFNYAVEPFFFKNADRKDADEIYAQVAQAFSLVGSIVYVGVMCFLEIIRILIGKNYREGLEVLPILLLAFFFLGLFYNFAAWYKLEDKTRYGGIIASGGAIITLIVSLTMIPKFGIYGPACAALACYLFMAAATYITGRKYRPIPYPIKRMGFYLFMALLGVASAVIIRNSLGDKTFLILGLNSLVFLIVTSVLFYVERHFIQSILSRTPKAL